MATESPTRAARAEVAPPEPTGYGWVIFAGAMLAIVGTLNVIYGIAAVDNSKFWIQDVKYVITDLNTWGWFLIVIGGIQVITAFAIWAGTEIGRWIGVFAAGCNAILQLLVLPGQPWLAVSLFAVDILVIYGLIAHGGHQSRA